MFNQFIFLKEGREDRGKFGQRFKSDNLGKTNKEKRKTKSFMMIKHKANKKQKRSYKDKTVSFYFLLKNICI
jgi:protein SDA1